MNYPRRRTSPGKGMAAGSPLVIPIVFQREPVHGRSCQTFPQKTFSEILVSKNLRGLGDELSSLISSLS